MNTAIATLHARPGAIDELESILRALQTETAAEPGAQTYDILRRDDDALVVYERYSSPEARAAHFGSAHLAAALAKARPLLASAPELQHLASVSCPGRQKVTIGDCAVEVVVLPIGRVSLVYARTATALLACGAIDPVPLGQFGIAAARVRPTSGTSVRNLDDLLAGQVREANELAAAKGVRVGMAGHEALRLLCGPAPTAAK